MAQQTINLGTVANDGTGDTLRVGGDKINDNFTELYAGLTGLLDFKGSTDASANPNYPAASKGDFYVVSVAGKIGGASGTVVEVGDAYFAEADNAGGTQAAVGTDWSVIQANIVGSTITELDDIPDVNAPTPADGDVLTWDATPGEWVSAAPTGGSNALDDLTDVDTTGVSDGDVLTFDSGSGDWVAEAPTGGSGAGPIGTTTTISGGIIEITGLSLSTYSKIDVDLEDLTAAASLRAWVQFQIGGNWIGTFAGTTGDYDYSHRSIGDSASTESEGGNNTDAVYFFDSTSANWQVATSHAAQIGLTIRNPGGTAHHKQFVFSANNGEGGSGVNVNVFGGGRVRQTGAITGVRCAGGTPGSVVSLTNARLTITAYPRS